MHGAAGGADGTVLVDTPTALGDVDVQDAARTGTSVLRALDMALDDAAMDEEVTPDVD